MTDFQRREFLGRALGTAAAAVAAGAIGGRSVLAADAAVTPDASTAAAVPGKIKKSLKFGMVQAPGTLLDKFRLLKEVGFDGVEIDSPTSFDKDEILKACEATGLVINGMVDGVHWKTTLSHPDSAVRAEGVEALKTALRETKLFGGTSVLLVPAVVNKEVSYDDAYRRSQEEIKKAIPVAEETGVRIALENVWNNFLVSPLETAHYIDEFRSPMVCSHFDVGNVLRYGWPEQWIRILGPRIFKLDVKEYSLKKMTDEGIYKGFNVPLLEGDCDWPAVMKALREINYSGWAAAEINAGGRDHLADTAQRMDRILTS